jgi:hypothetical protein
LRGIAAHTRRDGSAAALQDNSDLGWKCAAGAVRQSPHAREEKCMPGKRPSTRRVTARHGKSDYRIAVSAEKNFLQLSRLERRFGPFWHFTRDDSQDDSQRAALLSTFPGRNAARSVAQWCVADPGSYQWQRT